MRKKLLYYLVVSLLFLNSFGNAQCSISNTDLILPQAGGSAKWSQSFQANCNGILDKIRMVASSTANNITVTIYEGDGFSGDMLGSLSSQSITNAGSYTDYSTFDFSGENITLTNGNTYTMDFSSGSFHYDNNTSPDYSGGQLYFNNAAQPTLDLLFEIDVIAPTCNEPDIPSVSAQTVSCPSDDVSLTITGSLNDATEWIVYTGSCGGTEKTRGSSSTINIGKVTSTTTFYIRGEGGCVTPDSCASITVNPAVDNVKPTIASISNQTLNADASCEASLANYTSLAVVSDNCDTSPTVTQSPVAGTTITGFTTVTITVTDSSGNNNSTSFDVSLTDTTAPSIASISNQSISVSSACQASLPDYTSLAVVSDNCDASPTITQSPVAGTTITTTTTVTLTVTDASGNNNNTSFDASLNCLSKIYVDIDATGTNDGTSWTNAYSTLQDAIDAVQVDGEIWIAEGTYVPTQSPDDVSTNTRDYAFHINKNLKIYGGFSGTENSLSERNSGNTTILSGDLDNDNDISDNTYHVLITHGLSNSTIIDNIIITKANANASGDITFSGQNFGREWGAGMHNNASSPVITNVTFENNTSRHVSGGVLNANGSNPNLSNVKILSNSANYGAGIYNTGSSPILTNVIIANNSSGIQGGGLENFFSSPTLTNVVLANNTAANKGGAIYSNGNCTPTLNNLTIFNNTTNGTGAAIHNDNNSTPTINNTVFYQNTANGSTDDIANDGTSSTIGNNNASDHNNASGITVNLTMNPFRNTSNIIGDDNIFGTTDDGLTPNNTSSLVNAGNNTYNSESNDVSGRTRINKTTIDIGAYETETFIWTGTTNNDWATPTNWNENIVPTVTSDVIIPNSLSNYPTISSAVSVTSIDITSGASLIANAGITGDVIYHRNIPNTDWHLVASPVSGETIEDIITNHPLATGTVNTANLGFAPYTTTSATWNYQNTSSTGTLNNGQGYSVKLTSAADLIFKGSANTSSINFAVTNGANSFNLIGNPFTAYVNSATLTASNSSILSEQTVWLWNGTDYVTYNSANPIEIAPGQGFFIEARASNNFSFNQANQSHQGTDTFQRTAPKLTFDLLVADQTTERRTKIFFIDGKTTGFDNGYDSKMFTGVQQDFAIYTELVTDNIGKKLAIQTLPKDNLEAMVVPVGIIGKANQELTFSIQNINLPEGTEIYLEDKISNKFINLSIENYKITLENDSNSVGQFYIHAKVKSLSNDDFKDTPISIYKSSNNQVSITGLNTNAEIHLYSLLGKKIISQKLTPSVVNTITTPELSTGVYIVKVISETKEITKKITF